MADDEDIVIRNKFIRFSPTINMGHIFTAITIMLATAMAWAEMHSNINQLMQENILRKQEIVAAADLSEHNKRDIYDKIETTQKSIHDEIRDMRNEVSQNFNRLDDKLDRKQDKK